MVCALLDLTVYKYNRSLESEYTYMHTCVCTSGQNARTQIRNYTLFSSLFEEDFNVFVCRLNDCLNVEKIRLDYLWKSEPAELIQANR